MDRINVIPLKSFGEVRFGMKRVDVRKILGEAQEFKKSKFNKTTTDDFGFCHVYYNTADECEAVEFFGEIEVYVLEKKIFPGKIDEAKSVLKDLAQDGDDYTDTDDSIGIYAPSGEMESILFGESGYYA